MKYILLLLPFLSTIAIAQEKERTVSITCYVNPELYMDAGVIVHVSDKAGAISCRGNYVSIRNQSGNPFYYFRDGRWQVVKPQGTAVLLMSGNNSAAKTPSTVKLNVKYKTDLSGSVTTKIRTVDRLNAQSDQVKAREFSGAASPKPQEPARRPADHSVAKVSKPAEVSPKSPSPEKASPSPSVAKPVARGEEESVESKPKPRTAPPARRDPEPERQPAVTKSKPKSPAVYRSPRSPQGETREMSYRNPGWTNAAGLRLDFGIGNMGLGPNFKHKFNRKQALDAALIFFKGDSVALTAQFEHSFPVRTDPGLNLYIGIGPQLLFESENTQMALVPVAGLDYTVRGTALNFAFDWRPVFYLSDAADVEAGRFGLSLRFGF